MIGKFAYSLNGSEYTGQFDTRSAAESAAVEAARRSPAAPATVYVGRMVGPDAMAAGHARAVVSNMFARAREQAADSGDGYLAKVAKSQMDELDAALENSILGWLAKHELLPTYFRVESISEHTVPVASVKKNSPAEGEVYDLGVGRSVNGN
jgi:hypothetical protein